MAKREVPSAATYRDLLHRVDQIFFTEYSVYHDCRSRRTLLQAELKSWGNAYTTHLDKIRTAQNKCVKNIFFAQKRENATVYFNLLGILTINNAFKLKVAIFTFKIINDQICPVFANSIFTASSRHSFDTRFSSRQNFSRPKIRTTYGKHTFQFAASQIWETIDCNIKQSNSASSFKTKYRKNLLINQK